MTQFDLRQQLSSPSREILERAAQCELKRLRLFRDDVATVTRNTKGYHQALDVVDAQIAAVELAISQLAAVFMDQFELGRHENDRVGRQGLVNGEVVPA